MKLKAHVAWDSVIPLPDTNPREILRSGFYGSIGPNKDRLETLIILKMEEIGCTMQHSKQVT